MSISARSLAVACALLLLLIAAAGAGAWWYLFGPNQVDSADLVPANTLFYASIPNAANLANGYDGSKLSVLLANPNSKPLRDAFQNFIGTKNVELIQEFLPNLSGQSFVAVTHYDYQQPEKIGLIAAMKPKAGLGNFPAFVEKLKQAWPDMLRQGHTGKDMIDGVPYDWIRGPGAADKICVAQVNGWIVTSWGEAPLQDWIERFRHKSTTTSLAHDPNFQKTIQRVGDDPMALTYVNLQSVLGIAARQAANGDPVKADYLTKKLQYVGGAAIGTRFENRDIVDRYSVVFPKPVQIETGMPTTPCTFDSLQFTGPETCFYWASAVDWKQYYAHVKHGENSFAAGQANANPAAAALVDFLQLWIRDAHLDTQRNIAGALGPEISVQVEWSEEDTFPTAGLLVKVSHPDDFQPTIDALRETIRAAYATSADLQNTDVDGQKLTTLAFRQSSVLSPTMTGGGAYFGIFTTQDQAKRAFHRDAAKTISGRPQFQRQTGDLRTHATQLAFLDTPFLLDRAYKTAMPYLSLAGMFNKQVAGLLQGHELPENVEWLAPAGSWSFVVTPDEEGIQAYSVSGIGNQGLLISGLFGESGVMLNSMGYLPKFDVKPFLAPAPKSPDTASAITTGSPVMTVAPAAQRRIVIFITADNRILFNETSVAKDDLRGFLKSQRASNPNLDISVRVDANASPDILSSVMDAAMTAGFGELPYTYAPVPATAHGPGVVAGPTPSSSPTSTNAEVILPPPGPIHP